MAAAEEATAPNWGRAISVAIAVRPRHIGAEEARPMPRQETTQLVRRGLLLVKPAPDQRRVSLAEAEAALSATRERIGIGGLADQNQKPPHFVEVHER